MRLSHILSLALPLLSCSSCVSRAPTPVAARVTFGYKALSAMQAKDTPSFVYVFPPLRSSQGGRPIEKLIPVTSASGAMEEWKTSSALSMNLKRKISSQLTTRGYRVVTFEELLAVRIPYSVIVVSSFYTRPYDVKNEAGEVTDTATLVMIKASLFDANLDPKTKKDIITVDGLTKVPAGKEFPGVVDRTIRESFGWFADNANGTTLLD